MASILGYLWDNLSIALGNFMENERLLIEELPNGDCRVCTKEEANTTLAAENKRKALMREIDKIQAELKDIRKNCTPPSSL